MAYGFNTKDLENYIGDYPLLNPDDSNINSNLDAGSALSDMYKNIDSLRNQINELAPESDNPDEKQKRDALMYNMARNMADQSEAVNQDHNSKIDEQKLIDKNLFMLQGKDENEASKMAEDLAPANFLGLFTDTRKKMSDENLRSGDDIRANLGYTKLGDWDTFDIGGKLLKIPDALNATNEALVTPLSDFAHNITENMENQGLKSGIRELTNKSTLSMVPDFIEDVVLGAVAPPAFYVKALAQGIEPGIEAIKGQDVTTGDELNGMQRAGLLAGAALPFAIGGGAHALASTANRKAAQRYLALAKEANLIPDITRDADRLTQKEIKFLDRANKAIDGSKEQDKALLSYAKEHLFGSPESPLSISKHWQNLRDGISNTKDNIKQAFTDFKDNRLQSAKDAYKSAKRNISRDTEDAFSSFDKETIKQNLKQKYSNKPTTTTSQKPSISSSIQGSLVDLSPSSLINKIKQGDTEALRELLNRSDVKGSNLESKLRLTNETPTDVGDALVKLDRITQLKNAGNLHSSLDDLTPLQIFDSIASQEERKVLSDMVRATGEHGILNSIPNNKGQGISKLAKALNQEKFPKGGSRRSETDALSYVADVMAMPSETGFKNIFKGSSKSNNAGINYRSAAGEKQFRVSGEPEPLTLRQMQNKQKELSAKAKGKWPWQRAKAKEAKQQLAEVNKQLDSFQKRYGIKPNKSYTSIYDAAKDKTALPNMKSFSDVFGPVKTSGYLGKRGLYNAPIAATNFGLSKMINPDQEDFTPALLSALIPRGHRLGAKLNKRFGPISIKNSTGLKFGQFKNLGSFQTGNAQSLLKLSNAAKQAGKNGQAVNYNITKSENNKTPIAMSKDALSALAREYAREYDRLNKRNAA